MPLIVDTFNVLHTTGVLPPDLSGLDVEELRGVISLSRFRHQPIRLVCDGVEPASMRRMYEDDDFDWNRALTNIAVMWSGPTSDADTLIEILVAQDTAPRRLTVVTSDRRLGREVRKRRVRVMPSESFLERLGEDFRTNLEQSQRPHAPASAVRPPFAYDVPLNRDSVRWWLAYLGLDPDQPRVEGRHIAASPDARIIEDAEESIERMRSSQHGAHEVDPVRWWLRYFGFDPDQLPEEMLVRASPDDVPAPRSGPRARLSDPRKHGRGEADFDVDMIRDDFDDDNENEPIDIDSIDPDEWL